MILNVNIHPKSGYLFEDTDGARIFGQTWPGVFSRVRAYRERCGRPVGNPEEEVVAQACAREPILCQRGSNQTIADAPLPLKTKILAWMNGILQRRPKEPPSFVDERTAQDRTAVCAGCQFNKALNDGCASCRAAVKEMRGSILGNRFQDGRLNECEILAEDIPVSVHLEQTTVPRPELPGHCWRKRTL